MATKKSIGITCIYILLMILLVNSIYSTVIYDGIETVTVTAGNETLPSICSQLGNFSPEWRCWGNNHSTAYRLVVDNDTKLTINQGEKLFVGLGVDLYGELKIDRGFLYMNTSEAVSDTIGGPGSIINITGTQKPDRIPSPSENYDAGILLYPEGTSSYINFYIYGGKQLYFRDAKIETFAFELDEGGKKDIQRSYLRGLTSAVAYIVVYRDTDVLKNNYIDSGNKLNTANFAFLYSISGAGNNITNVFLNQTNSAFAGIYAEEGTITDINNGGMDTCYIQYNMTAGTPTRVRFINTSFVRNRTLESCRFYPFPGSAFDARNNITISYPLDIYTEEPIGIPEDNEAFTVYRTHYRNNWTAIAERWEQIYSGSTDGDGRFSGLDLTALNHVFTNQTERYIYQINFTKPSHINKSIILNWSDYNRGVVINITINESFNITMDMTLNLSPVTYLNVSRFTTSYLSGKYVSNYYTTESIGLWSNNIKIMEAVANNNTAFSLNMNNLSLGENKLSLRFGSLKSDNYSLFLTNSTSSKPIGGTNGAYISIVLILIAVIAFLLFIAEKSNILIDFFTIETQKENEYGEIEFDVHQIHMIRFIMYLIAGWVAWVLITVATNIAELERLTPLYVPIDIIYSIIFWLLIFFTSAWTIGLLIFIIRRIRKWVNI